MPVWPHQEFASAWEKDDFPDCKPKQIALEEWLMSWLPGMEKNGTLVLVFPLGEDEDGVWRSPDTRCYKPCCIDRVRDHHVFTNLNWQTQRITVGLFNVVMFVCVYCAR